MLDHKRLRKIVCGLFFICVLLMVAHSAFAGGPPKSFGCYFEMDDKYYNEDYKKDEIIEWQQQKIRDFLKEGAQPGIFAQNSGGPLGGEWNSNGNIFCIAFVNISPDSIFKKEVYLDKKSVAVKFNTQGTNNQNESAVSFTIASKAWQRSLRPLKKSDFNYLNRQENLDDWIKMKTINAIQIHLRMFGKSDQIFDETGLLIHSTGE